MDLIAYLEIILFLPNNLRVYFEHLIRVATCWARQNRVESSGSILT